LRLLENENKSVDKTSVDGSLASTQQKLDNYSLFNDRIKELVRRNASAEEVGRAFGNVINNSPHLRNAVLKNLKTAPHLPNREEIEKALTDPRNNEKTLRAISNNLINTCYPMYKLLRFYDGVLTYKWQLFPQNVNVSGMKTPRFQEEQRFVNQWVKKLNPPYQLRRVVQETLQSGKRAYYLREIFTEDKKNENALEEGILPYSKNKRVVSVRLEDLPDDYIKIVGRSNQSYYTIAFDFTYFYSQTSVDISNFPTGIQKIYEKLKNFMGNQNGKAVINNLQKAQNFDGLRKFAYNVESRNNNQYIVCSNYWVDLPADECQVFSADESNPLQVPNFLGLFLMCADLQGFALLQQELTGIPLYSTIVGRIPMQKDNVGLALKPEEVEYYQNMMQSILPPGVSFVMTPSQENTSIVFDELPNANKVYMSGLQGFIGTAGMTGVLSTTDKPNLSQNKTSQLIEKRFIDVFYEQFKDFVNRRLEKMTSDGVLRYDWQFDIYGDVFADKDEKDNLLKALSQGLISMFPRWASYYGYTVDDMKILAGITESSGIYDMLKPLVSAFQMSGKDEVGRKDKSEDDIENDNTEKSKEAGTNKVENRVNFSYYDIDEMNDKLNKVLELVENFVEGGE